MKLTNPGVSNVVPAITDVNSVRLKSASKGVTYGYDKYNN